MFHANPTQINQFAQQLTTLSQQITDAVTELEQLTTNLHLHWEGEAATAQREAHQKNMQDIQQLRDTLAHLTRNTHAAHTNYQGAILAEDTITRN